jgi:hypothetical protein
VAWSALVMSTTGGPQSPCPKVAAGDINNRTPRTRKVNLRIGLLLSGWVGIRPDLPDGRHLYTRNAIAKVLVYAAVTQFGRLAPKVLL